MNISIIETKSVPTIKIETSSKIVTLHSKYNPLREAQSWAKQEIKGINLSEYDEITVLGIGAGYHIQALSEIIPNIPIQVIELNTQLFNWFTESYFNQIIDTLANVTIKNLDSISKKQRHILFSSLSSSNLLIHKSTLDILPKEHEGLKEILEDIQFKKHSIRNQIDHMKENFIENTNLNDKGILNNLNMFGNKPMILISAGPSLDKQIPLLKEIHKERKFILCAVGTSLKPLINNDIIPNICSIIDPNPGTLEQLTDLNLKDTTLYYMSTTYYKTVAIHKGPRRILWQKGFKEAELRAIKGGEPLIETGGSVATALLSLMTLLGTGPIALVGQDLAYTNGLSHATHAHAQKKLIENEVKYNTLNYDQTNTVPTARNLTIYRKWFEEFANKKSRLDLYNCTEGGAYINNWKHISLNEFYKQAKK